MPETVAEPAPPKRRRRLLRRLAILAAVACIGEIGDGFVLYSVGPNGTDDGGLTQGQTDGEGREGDDVRFGLDPADAR